MRKLYLLILAMSLIILFNKCEKELEGQKTVKVNFTNAKTGEPVDSIFCFIGQAAWIYYRPVSEAQSDINGNCKLEAYYTKHDRYSFVIKQDFFITCNYNKVFTYRARNESEKYRVKGDRPKVDFGDQNDFNLNIQLIPLIKLDITFDFGKTYKGSVNFETFENDESIYYIIRGNDAWMPAHPDSIDCYVSSIGKTKFVYSFKTNEGKTVFSKSCMIDPNTIQNKRFNIRFD